MAAPDFSWSDLGDTFSGMFEGMGGALGDIGGIAGALGAGGPQAMTNFVNKIADKQNMEISRKWDSFQKGQDRSFQMLRDSSQRRHEMGMLQEKHRLDTARTTGASIGRTASQFRLNPAAFENAKLSLPPEIRDSLASSGATIEQYASVIHSIGGERAMQPISEASQATEETRAYYKSLGLDPPTGIAPSILVQEGIILETQEGAFIDQVDGIKVDIDNITALATRAITDPTKNFEAAQAGLDALDLLTTRIDKLIGAESDEGSIGPSRLQDDQFSFFIGTEKHKDKWETIQRSIASAQQLLRIKKEHGGSAAAASTLTQAVRDGDLPAWLGFDTGAMPRLQDWQRTLQMPEVVNFTSKMDTLFQMISDLSPAARVEILGDSYRGSPLERTLADWTAARGEKTEFNGADILTSLRETIANPKAAAQFGELNYEAGGESTFQRWSENLQALESLDPNTIGRDILERKEVTKSISAGSSILKSALPPQMLHVVGPDIFEFLDLDRDILLNESQSDTSETLAGEFMGRGLKPYEGFDPTQVMRIKTFSADKFLKNSQVINALAKRFLTPIFEGMNPQERLRQGQKLASMIGEMPGVNAAQSAQFKELLKTAVKTQFGLGGGGTDFIFPETELHEALDYPGRPGWLDNTWGVSSDPNRGDSLVADASTARPLDVALEGSRLASLSRMVREGRGTLDNQPGTKVALDGEVAGMGYNDFVHVFSELIPDLKPWLYESRTKFVPYFLNPDRSQRKTPGHLLGQGTFGPSIGGVPGRKSLGESGPRAGDRSRQEDRSRRLTLDALRNFPLDSVVDPDDRRLVATLQNALRDLPDEVIVDRLVGQDMWSPGDPSKGVRALGRWTTALSDQVLSFDELLSSDGPLEGTDRIASQDERLDVPNMPTLEDVNVSLDETRAALAALPSAIEANAYRMVDVAFGDDVDYGIVDQNTAAAMKLDLETTLGELESLKNILDDPFIVGSYMNLLPQIFFGPGGTTYALTPEEISNNLTDAMSTVGFGGGGYAAEAAGEIEALKKLVAAQENTPLAVRTLLNGLAALAPQFLQKGGRAAVTESGKKSPIAEHISGLFKGIHADINAISVSEDLTHHVTADAPASLSRHLGSVYDNFRDKEGGAFNRALIMRIAILSAENDKALGGN